MNARGNVNDLLAFLAVAKERSFTRAAAKLGVSQSALSHTIRGLEERLGLRLLTRTTRRVAPTEVGERLLRTVGPRFDEIDAELAALSELREKPAGTIRITTVEYAAESILWPALVKLLPQYPDIKVEIIVDYGLTDIVAERYDAGVRLGEQVAKDMIAQYTRARPGTRRFGRSPLVIEPAPDAVAGLVGLGARAHAARPKAHGRSGVHGAGPPDRCSKTHRASGRTSRKAGGW